MHNKTSDGNLKTIAVDKSDAEVSQDNCNNEKKVSYDNIQEENNIMSTENDSKCLDVKKKEGIIASSGIADNEKKIDTIVSDNTIIVSENKDNTIVEEKYEDDDIEIVPIHVINNEEKAEIVDEKKEIEKQDETILKAEETADKEELNEESIIKAEDVETKEELNKESIIRAENIKTEEKTEKLEEADFVDINGFLKMTSTTTSEGDISFLNARDNYIENDEDEIMNEPYIDKSLENTKIENIKKVKKQKAKKEKTKKKKMPVLAKIAITFALLFIVFAGAMAVAVKAGIEKFNYVNWENTTFGSETFETESPEEKGKKVDEEVKAEDVVWDSVKGSSVYNENIINILMVGDDQDSDDDGHGNSDSMMILTINKDDKTLKLTSIMRDMYVPIEGYSDNRINAAYNTGGVKLLKSTIEDNFKIVIDSAIVVHFDTFVELIDKLGGITVTLNEQEAKYINGKINKEKANSSKLVAGEQELNGEQSLWFSRIRKVSSDIYGRDDFGRTCRQREVINQLYEKYKDLSYIELVKLINVIIKLVDLDENLKNQMLTLARLSLSFEVDEIESMRFPVDNAYTNARVYRKNGTTMLILRIDDYLQQNIDALHMFIYGDTNY